MTTNTREGLADSDRRLYSELDSSSLTLYCFVAASNRDAMFTFGDRYDASIL
jgi:hypothetical protein